MDSEIEYESDEEIGGIDEPEFEIDEVSVENLLTHDDPTISSETAHTMNVPSVLRPPSNDMMAGVIPTHEPPSLPLEMGQSVNQNRCLCCSVCGWWVLVC